MREIRIYNQRTYSQPSFALTAVMIVCVCQRVSDRDIARHVRAGWGFDDIQLELGVATQCGRCEGCAREVVAQCSSTHPVAALHCASESQTQHADSSVSVIQLASAITESRAWNMSSPLAQA